MLIALLSVLHCWHVLVKHAPQKSLIRGHQRTLVIRSGVPCMEGSICEEYYEKIGKLMVVFKNEEHVYNKHRRVTNRSPCVLRNSAILRWQFFIIDEGKKLLPYRFRTVADDLHLGKRRSGQNRLEEPEDPRHKRGDIYEKLACLVRTVSVYIGEVK